MHIAETDLGSIVKRARLNKELKQEDLAEKAGVGLRHIQSIENEGGFPSYEVLYKLIRELNIKADEIFYPELYAGDSELERLIRLLGQCSDRDISLVTALVEKMLGDTEDR